MTTRRTFLKALGSALIASRAEASTPREPRLVIVYSPDGTEPPRWRPVGERDNFTFSSGSILEPLLPMKDELVVVDGVGRANAREHFVGMPMMLTNKGYDQPTASMARGPSVDQFIATRLRTNHRFRSIELGVQSSLWGVLPEARMCFTETGRPVPPNENPYDVYRRLFGFERADAARLLADRRSVLDLLRKETRELSGRLSGEERVKLDIHLDALRDMERGLDPNDTFCGPASPASPFIDPFANDQFPAVGRMQMDMLVAALACDLTRVISLQWSFAASPTLFTWLGHAEDHHGVSHAELDETARVQAFIDDERWYAAQFGYLIRRMASIPDPTGPGSLLDGSIVLWISEVGDRRSHSLMGLPVVVAGRGAGLIEPGRYLRYDDVSHAKLLTSICRAMGLHGVDHFGDAATGVGPLPGLFA